MYPTILDIAKANGNDAVVGLIDEAVKTHPELTLGFARPLKGIFYETLVRTAVPTGGGFRNANQGVVAVKGTYENRVVRCYTFNKRWECDKAVADRYEDGAEAFIALEASGIMEGGTQDLAKQFYYGRNATFGDAAGFPGLLDAYDATNMVVDAGGTSDSVNSSVWLVRFGPKDVAWVWGKDGSMDMSDAREESITPDPTNAPTAKLTAYVQELLAYPGLQVGSLMSVVRIKKLSTDAGKGLTDTLINAALEKFPAGTAPDVILGSRRSRQQLRDSRTATTTTGADAAPITTIPGLNGQNIPFLATDAISNVETLAL
jgi:hypothetical protein